MSAVSHKAACDTFQQLNTFAHVNYTENNPVFGLLLCINGCGSFYAWLRRMLSGPENLLSYDELNALSAQAEAGSSGLTLFPFGNGAERSLGNRNPGAAFQAIDFQRHGKEEIVRAGKESIAYALAHGLERMQALGGAVTEIRAGNANLFQSEVFCEIISALSGCEVALFNTDGAAGAARGAGIGAGIYGDQQEAFSKLA